MSDYDHIEKVLAEIIVEVTGEPRIGRYERTAAKSALARLRECGMALAERLESQGEPSAHDDGCEADWGPEGQESPCRCAERAQGEPSDTDHRVCELAARVSQLEVENAALRAAGVGNVR